LRIKEKESNLILPEHDDDDDDDDDDDTHKPKLTFCLENSLKMGDTETEMYEGWEDNKFVSELYYRFRN
jgi:hypothetical protein